MRTITVLFFCLLICAGKLQAQAKTDTLLLQIFRANEDSVFQKVIAEPLAYRVQIIYTQIERDQNNHPRFRNYYFNYDPKLYFNPASMVKMPLAFLSLEKLHGLRMRAVDKNTTILFDSSQPWHRPLYVDTTAKNGLPSIAQFIRRAFLISENDPYNRMYQFLGQGYIHEQLQKKGYRDVRITRQFLGLSAEQNRHTNGYRFVDEKGKVLFQQPPQVNTGSFDFRDKFLVGRAHYNRNDSLINSPFDFTEQNYLSLLSMQQMLQNIMFPGSVDNIEPFRLSKKDYRFIYRYLSQYPSETPYPKYDTSLFYDSYVKFFFRDSTRRMPEGLRVFNKVGWSYGFLTDVSYVADFNNKIEYMLSATVYVNSDGVLNDNQYEYESKGHPFLYQLGRSVYRYELGRNRDRRPDLSRFRIRYEKPAPDDRRPFLREVDN